MKDFEGRIAVVTGGGTGMGRELARQLSREGCHVAVCDISVENMEETQALCRRESPEGTRFSLFQADVSQEDQVMAFRDHVASSLETSHINLLFNNAGISSGGSFVSDSRADWDHCFGVCWFGVYYTSRAFMPALVASSHGHIVNTSSVNGFWATVGRPHTAYSTAKFAVKGFTEALIEDMRNHAPHVGVSLVCPGHVGTDIAINSLRKQAHGTHGDEMLEGVRRALLADRATPEAFKTHLRGANKEEMLAVLDIMGDRFRDTGMSASDAAAYILNAVQAGQWRVLVGKDAEALDAAVRREPGAAYEPGFVRAMLKTFRATEQQEGGNSNLAAQQQKLGLAAHPAAKL